MCLSTLGVVSHNVSLVCDAAPSPTRARGRCGDEARPSAAEPEPPQRGGDAHYVQLCEVPLPLQSIPAVNAQMKDDARDSTRLFRLSGAPKNAPVTTSFARDRRPSAQPLWQTG